MPEFRLRPLVQLASALLVCAAPLTSWAQAPALDGLLGTDEAGLLAAVPQAQRLSKPRLGPRGLRGQWVASPSVLAGLPFEAVFFFRNKQLQRVEQLWSATGAACGEQNSFTPLNLALQSRFGANPVLASGGEGGEQQVSAAWTQEASEVVAHYSRSAARCTLRVVYQAREAKDASEL